MPADQNEGEMSLQEPDQSRQKPGLLRRSLDVFQGTVLVALIYTVVVFLLGWSMGGPDVLDGTSVFSSSCAGLINDKWVVASAILTAFLLSLLLLQRFAPRPEAWLTNITQKRGVVVGLIVLIISGIMSGVVFWATFVATGCRQFAGDLSTIAIGGILAGGFLQVMAAAVQPNPHSEQQRKLLQRQKETVRKEAVRRDLDPDEAEVEVERIWNETGKGIGNLMESMYGFVTAAAGGGTHGTLLFILGASFFVGLGLGVSGSAIVLLYVLPLLIALADTATLLSFRATISRATGTRRAVWAATLSMPIALLGMMYKALFVVVGAAMLGRIGGPDVPWRLYWQAALEEPLGRGLTVSALLLLSLAWPISLLVGPLARSGFLGRE